MRQVGDPGSCGLQIIGKQEPINEVNAGKRFVAVRPFRRRAVLVQADGGFCPGDYLPGVTQANIGAVSQVGPLGKRETELSRDHIVKLVDATSTMLCSFRSLQSGQGFSLRTDRRAGQRLYGVKPGLGGRR